MALEKIQFEINAPVTVTLKHSTGKIVDGKFGRQVYFTLEGFKCMYLDFGAAEQLNALKPEPGESFVICKRGKREWDVSLSPATEKMRAAKEMAAEPAPRPTPVPPAMARRLDAAPEPQQLGTGTSARPAPRLQTSANPASGLVAEANAVVDAFAQVLDRALTQYQGRVKPEEVRSLLLSAYIQRGKAGSYPSIGVAQ